MKIGIQTKYIVDDRCPETGFAMLSEAGFSCADFSLNAYLSNDSIYRSELNDFFSQSTAALEHFFGRHKRGAKEAGIAISQMHMPSPVYVPEGMPGSALKGRKETNDYMWNVVALKSMEICRFFECPFMVIHGFKPADWFSTETEQWEKTEEFINFLAPVAKDMGITICIENLFHKSDTGFREGPGCNAQKAAERIDRMNEKYKAQVLGFCFDTGHANLIGIDPEPFITALGHRLKVLHIHDNDGTGDLHQIPFTSAKSKGKKAAVDWDGFIAGLKNIQFDEVLNFETAPAVSVFPEEIKRDVLKLIAGIGKYFSRQLE